jgi:hypothetical protein
LRRLLERGNERPGHGASGLTRNVGISPVKTNLSVSSSFTPQADLEMVAPLRLLADCKHGGTYEV